MRITFNPSTVAALTSPPNNKDITFDLRGQNIFARGVKFYGTDTWRPVVDNLTSNSATSSLSANQGRVLAGLINGKSNSDHNHDGRYIRKSGDTMLGALNFANATWNKVGDDVYMGDHNIRGQLCIMGINSTTGLSFHKYGDASIRKSITFDGNTLYMNGNCNYATSSNQTNLLAINTVPNKTAATSIGSWSPISGRYVFHQKWTDTSTGGDAANFGIYLDGNLTANMVLDGYYNSLLGFRVIGATGGFLKANGTIDNSTYLTSHQSLSNYYTKGEINNQLGKYKLKSSIWVPETKVIRSNFRDFLNKENLHKQAPEELNLYRFFAQNDESNYSSKYNYPVVDSHAMVFSIDGNNGYIRSMNFDSRSNDVYVTSRAANGEWRSWVRLLNTSDVAGLKGNLTVHQYLSNTNTTWYPLIWGGSSHVNTSDSTGTVCKSYDKLSWQTSSQTLYATNIQTENIKRLSIGGGIFWNPNVESANDSTDAASITLVKSGVAGGTTLVLSQMNDANDTIQFKTSTAARLYHNSYPILTTQNTYVSNHKGYINGTEITQVNNADTLDGAHLIRYGNGTGIKQVYYFHNVEGRNASYIKLGTLNTVAVVGANASKVMFTVKGGISGGRTNESVYEVAASTRGSIQVTSTLVRGSRELKFGYVSTSSNVEIWMAYDEPFRGATEVEVSSSIRFTLAMTETTTKPSGFVEGSYRILASTADNVASATNAYHLRINSANTWSTWYWVGQGGQPSWLWGSNNGTNMYVWNPSNFRVAYAASAGNADTVDGEHASNFVRAGVYEQSNLNSLDTYSFIRSVYSTISNTSPNGNTGWYNVIQAVHRNGANDGPNYIGQIALGMTTNINRMFYRTKYNGSWYAWNEVVTTNTGLLRYSRNNVNISSPNCSLIPPSLLEWTVGYPRLYDPEFNEGNNNVQVYNNAGNGVVTVTRVHDTNVGNSSSYVMKVVSASGADPNYGGWHVRTQTELGKVYTCLFRASIPSGVEIKFDTNSIGSGGSSAWLTNNIGTGKWTWYAMQVYCGPGGSTTFFFSAKKACTWYLSYVNVIENNRASYAGLRSVYSDYLKANASIVFGRNELQYFNQYTGVTAGAKNNANPKTGWYHILRMNHADNSGYFVDLAIPFYDNKIQFRRITHGSDNGWRRVITEEPNHDVILREASTNGNVGIGINNPAYKLDVNGQMRAQGFHHQTVNSDNYILLAGGGYKSFGGDESNPIFLGYLNLDHGDDGTIDSYFSCLRYSVPFTYTRGGHYCRIQIPNTTHQVFHIRAVTASVNYSGGGMDTWTGNNRGAGAWWLHCYTYNANEIRVKGFCQSNSHNDSWWGGNPLWSGNDGVNKITVCIFGYVEFK